MAGGYFAEGFIGVNKSRYNKIKKTGKIDLVNGDYGRGVYVAFDKFVAGSYGDIIVPVVVKCKNINSIDGQDFAMAESKKEEKGMIERAKVGYDAVEIFNTVGGRKYPINGRSELWVRSPKNVRLT
jgi:hypothetical protein